MTVKKQRPIVFTNKCGCDVNEDWLSNAMIWYAEGYPQCSKKNIFMHGRYPAVSIFGKKIHVHRLMMMHATRGRLANSVCCHHKDGDRLNARYDNLELMDASSHCSRHNKGKTLSEEHRAKISEANRKRKGIKIKKRVDIPYIKLKALLNQGKSINYCAKFFECDWSTVKSRVHENPELLED